MLLALRDYIKKQGVVSASQLARAFGLDEEALEPMIAIWINKGCVKRHSKLNCGAACARCQKPPVYYQYDDR